MGWIRNLALHPSPDKKQNRASTAICVEEKLRAGTYDGTAFYFILLLLCVLWDFWTDEMR